jgi:hypothetical protein
LNRAETKNPAMDTQKNKVSAQGPVPAHSPAKRARQTVAPTGNPKLAALKRSRFTKRGRTKRIQRAQQALGEIDRIGSTFKLDKDTLIRLAEDPDFEYL